MKKTLLYHSFVFFLLYFSFSLFQIQSVKATTLTLSPPLLHDGLHFSEPLTFSPASENSLKSKVIKFGEKEMLHIVKPKKQSVLAETLITPKPSPLLTRSQITPIPTPTLNPQITTPVITQTPTPTPTEKPQTPTPTPASTKVSLSTSGGLDAEKLFSMSNSHRASLGLPAFEKDDTSCQLAASRAPEIEGEVASGNMHSGLKARNLPYWNTENIISMRTEEEAFNWWINDYIHRIAIEGDFKYSCVACSGNSCAQEFTNYQPK